mgnify:CR=1 FL=1
MQPDDTALIFLAGHGVNDVGNGQYLFLPRDADLQSLARTTLPATEIQQVLTALQTRVLLLLDTCHSGNVMPGRASVEVDCRLLPGQGHAELEVELRGLARAVDRVGREVLGQRDRAGLLGERGRDGAPSVAGAVGRCVGVDVHGEVLGRPNTNCKHDFSLR